jgi:hypothetical protein
MAQGFAVGRVLGYVTWCVVAYINCSSMLINRLSYYCMTVIQVLGSVPGVLVELQAQIRVLPGMRMPQLLLLLLWSGRFE